MRPAAARPPTIHSLFQLIHDMGDKDTSRRLRIAFPIDHGTQDIKRVFGSEIDGRVPPWRWQLRLERGRGMGWLGDGGGRGAAPWCLFSEGCAG